MVATLRRRRGGWILSFEFCVAWNGEGARSAAIANGGERERLLRG